jgi:hypothetical protein
MNIQEFKNKLIGGGARANMFRVDGTFPAISAALANVNPANDIRFLCSAASIPAVTIGTVTTYFQGRPFVLAGDRSFSAWSITVINDTGYPLRKAFEAWSNRINSIETNVSRLGLGEYAQQWRVTQLDRQGRDVQTYRFVDCWPSAISDIALDYGVKDAIETFTVELQYQYYQIAGSIST